MAITNYRAQIAMAIFAGCVLVTLSWKLRIFMVMAFVMAQDYDWSGLLDKFQEARRNRHANQNIQEKRHTQLHKQTSQGTTEQ